jgi:uncharacterized protein DUF3592
MQFSAQSGLPTVVYEILAGLAVMAFSYLALTFRTVSTSMRDRRAQNWPAAKGNVVSCDVKTYHGRFSDYAVGVLGYSYEVNGEYYSGYFERQYNDEQTAWTFVDSRRNLPVVVRYKANNPQTSVLRDEDQGAAT